VTPALIPLEPPDIGMPRDALNAAITDLGRIDPDSDDLSVWMREVEVALSPLYKQMFSLLMSALGSRRAVSAPPPLDPAMTFGLARDATTLARTTDFLTAVLSDPDLLQSKREEFPHNDLGSAVFDLALVLDHLSDVQFPTLGRIDASEDVEWLRLRLDDREVELLRRRGRTD